MLLALAPSLLLASGILAATYISALAAESRWLVMAGPLLLALTVVVAVVLVARTQAHAPGITAMALILVSSILLAGFIVTLRDPGMVAMFLPIFGGACAPLLLSVNSRRRWCKGS
jgi:hypothetical protein